MKEEAHTIAGRFHSNRPFEVTAEKIATFCAAVGEDNPLFIDPVAAQAGPYGGLVAPPAFAASFRRAEPNSDQEALFPRGGLMAGIDMEFAAPIRPDDSISTATEVKDTYEKTGRSGTMTFTVIRSTLTNQNGEVVAYIDYRMMNRHR
jgi:3-hydroxybutyryl-CoA dehydratase